MKEQYIKSISGITFFVREADLWEKNVCKINIITFGGMVSK